MSNQPISEGLYDPFEHIPRGEANITHKSREKRGKDPIKSVSGDVPEWVDHYQPKSKPNDHNKRSKELLEKHGFSWGKCEAYNAFSGKKTDLIGFMDYMAMSPEHGILGVQVTSYSNAATRFTKAKHGELKKWLESGGKFVVIGWVKAKNNRWAPYCIWPVLVDGEVVKKTSYEFADCFKEAA